MENSIMLFDNSSKEAAYRQLVASDKFLSKHGRLVDYLDKILRGDGVTDCNNLKVESGTHRFSAILHQIKKSTNVRWRIYRTPLCNPRYEFYLESKTNA